MSYVRRTYALIEGVQAKVDSMQHAELSRLSHVTSIDIGTPLHDEFRKVVTTIVWQEAPDLADKMPESWCKMSDSVDVKFTQGSHLVRSTIEMATGDKIKMPPMFSRWDTVEIDDTQTTPLIKEWLSKRYTEEEKRSEIFSTFDTIKKQLTKYLESHASLNTAIKEMPELEMYVPQEYLDKLAEKTVRDKPKKKESAVEKLAIDVNALTQAAVAHRITSSGGF